MANTENHKRPACLADLKWEFGFGGDRDRQVERNLNKKMSDNDRKQELERKKAKLAAIRWCHRPD